MDKKIAILTMERKHGRKEGSIGSSMIRGRWLVKHWPGAELWTEGMPSDVMIFQKVYWPEMMEIYPGIKILDLCDPDWITGELELVKLSKMVDAITCSSKGISDFVSKVVDIPVKHIPDRLDLDFFDVKKEHKSKAKSVVWFGYIHNAKNIFQFVLPSLAKLGLDLIVISNEPYQPGIDYGVKITNIKFSWETIKYDLTRGDIVINPQPADNKRFIYKSENKTWISWALGMPVANDIDEMKKFLDPDERKTEANEKLKFVKENCDIKQSVIEFKELIELCRKRKEI